MVPFSPWKYNSIFSGSNSTPAYPKAQRILPQLASCPKIAAFVDEIECIDLFEGENERERILIFEIQ